MNIDFPFQFNPRGQTGVNGRDDHIKDMIELLLFTNPGERVNRPDFGSGLRQFVFAPNSSELVTALHFSLQATLQSWLGDMIDLETLEVAAEDEQLHIHVRYRIREDLTSRELKLTGGINHEPK